MDEITRARKVFEIESTEIARLSERLDGRFKTAIDVLFDCKGKVVCTGIGKSGIVARKLAATLSSTGSPALFLHAAESSHGDLGAIAADDVVIAISNSGESSELADLLKYTVRRGIPIVALTGNANSTLGKASKAVLDVHVDAEACPIGLAPTASSAVTMAMGDALAMVLMERRGFKAKDFAEFHPGGSLGKRLLTRVEDLMHASDKGVVIAKSTTKVKEIIFAMTDQEVKGISAIVNESGELIGSLTDGDLRRRLNQTQNLLEENAGDLMSHNPKTIDRKEMAERALYLMEEFSIQALIVLDKESENPKKPVGIIHLQDLLASGIR
ncbi:MAG: KpsF/GutQ family sugar-phosphate isomerase [Bdellovibrionales bacterium]|nr:KpsF/GutQ family sugar-phosphate isomerase [Bdellovibrionales bacterium]